MFLEEEKNYIKTNQSILFHRLQVQKRLTLPQIQKKKIEKKYE